MVNEVRARGPTAPESMSEKDAFSLDLLSCGESSFLQSVLKKGVYYVSVNSPQHAASPWQAERFYRTDAAGVRGGRWGKGYSRLSIRHVRDHESPARSLIEQLIDPCCAGGSTCRLIRVATSCGPGRRHPNASRRHRATTVDGRYVCVDTIRVNSSGGCRGMSTRREYGFVPRRLEPSWAVAKQPQRHDALQRFKTPSHRNRVMARRSGATSSPSSRTPGIGGF